MQEIKNEKIVVLGMGNILLKDEGIGVHVIRTLQRMPGLENVLFIDGGTSPEALDLVKEIERLIIVDAIRSNGEPGSVYQLSPEQIETAKPSSIHEISVVSMLQNLSIQGNNPEVTIFGIEPKEIDWGLELSSELTHRLPIITGIIYKEIQKIIKTRIFYKRRGEKNEIKKLTKDFV